MPIEYRKRLGELTDRAKPQPYSYVEHMMRTELGDGFLEVFSDVDADATAAASIAQVSIRSGNWAVSRYALANCKFGCAVYLMDWCPATGCLGCKVSVGDVTGSDLEFWNVEIWSSSEIVIVWGQCQAEPCTAQRLKERIPLVEVCAHGPSVCVLVQSYFLGCWSWYPTSGKLGGFYWWQQALPLQLPEGTHTMP